MKKKTKKKSKVLLILAIILFVGLLYYVALLPNFVTNNKEEQYVYIRPNTTIDSVMEVIEKGGFLKNKTTFALMAKIYKPTNKIVSGAYLVQSDMSNIRFLNNIYKGYQSPVKLKINNVRLKKQLVVKICKQTCIDSLRLYNLLNDSIFLRKYNLTVDNCLTLFIPNTYEIYWSISPEKLFDKMKGEYDKFWTADRRDKAAAIPLSPTEASILASIVDEETNKTHEKPIIAGLYINRLKIGMKLQADPTARYALNDFTINQVYHTYTRINSPYNTYMYPGLPPGPIRISSIEGIDAVLNYKPSNYLYMCAKPELNGEHNFSENYEEHQRYAAAYYKALKAWKAKNNL